MKYRHLLFNILVFESRCKHKIVNIFHNQSQKRVGYLDRDGNLYGLNCEKPVKKMGKFQWNEDGIYHADDVRWYETKIKPRGNVNWKNHFIEQYIESDNEWALKSEKNCWFWSHVDKIHFFTASSSPLYTDFQLNTFHEIFMNGSIYQNGTKLIGLSKDSSLWTAATMFGVDSVLTVDEGNHFMIQNISKREILFEIILPINMPGQKITINKEGNFIHVFIFFPTKGVYVLKFYGSFEKLSSSFYLSIPMAKYMASDYPYLTVLDENSKLFIYHIHNNDSYEQKYSSHVKMLPLHLEQFIQYKTTIYAHDCSKLYKLVYVL